MILSGLKTLQMVAAKNVQPPADLSAGNRNLTIRMSLNLLWRIIEASFIMKFLSRGNIRWLGVKETGRVRDDQDVVSGPLSQSAATRSATSVPHLRPYSAALPSLTTRCHGTTTTSMTNDLGSWKRPEKSSWWKFKSKNLIEFMLKRLWRNKYRIVIKRGSL